MPDRERCRNARPQQRPVHGTSGGRGDVPADAAEVVAGFGVGNQVIARMFIV
jgi:hypothetical protein